MPKMTSLHKLMRSGSLAVLGMTHGACGNADDEAERDSSGSASSADATGTAQATTADATGPISTSGASDSADTTTSATTVDTTDTDTDTTGGEVLECGARPLEGYGSLSTFGAGGETCVVSNLDDAGPGSLRDCVGARDTTNDSPTPRLITFDVGGTITLLTDLAVRQPYLTVDGFSAPSPGITLAKQGGGEDGGLVVNTWPGQQTCGHDVLVQGLRLEGVWTEDTEEHSQAAGTLGIDGEDRPLCLRNVVFHGLTVIRAQDGGGDIWGSAQDVTVQYSAFLKSLHPNTFSHAPGGEPDQQRERISVHHNLYAYTHERGPQIRGDIRDANFEQNIMHEWAAYGFGGGYGTRFRCRDGACPTRINVIDNHWTAAGAMLTEALVMGEASGPADDDPIAPAVFSSGNRVPRQNVDDGSAASEFERSPEAQVTVYPDDQLVADVLPCVGAPYRTREEDVVFTEVAAQLGRELN